MHKLFVFSFCCWFVGSTLRSLAHEHKLMCLLCGCVLVCVSPVSVCIACACMSVACAQGGVYAAFERAPEIVLTIQYCRCQHVYQLTSGSDRIHAHDIDIHACE